MKIAIIGNAESKKNAPYTDSEWKIWGLNEEFPNLPRGDTWFQIHDRGVVDINAIDPEHLNKLKASTCPIYMQKKRKDIPNSVSYPFNEMTKIHGKRFASTMDYMMALAISMNPEEIGIWGVNLAIGSEYEHQRPTLMYFIGYAEGKGINVYVDPTSGFIKDEMYGQEGDTTTEQIILFDEIEKYKELLYKADIDMAFSMGVKSFLEKLLVQPNIDVMGAKAYAEGKMDYLSSLQKQLKGKIDDMQVAIFTLQGKDTTV
jgi:hypothetical protein